MTPRITGIKKEGTLYHGIQLAISSDSQKASDKTEKAKIASRDSVFLNTPKTINSNSTVLIWGPNDL